MGKKATKDVRRRYPRFPLDVDVLVKLFGPEGLSDFRGRSFELGQNGLGAMLAGEISPGEVVTLELALPASETPLKLRAVVRYRDGLRHGFEFLGRDESQQEVIRQTCELLAAAKTQKHQLS